LSTRDQLTLSSVHYAEGKLLNSSASLCTETLDLSDLIFAGRADPHFRVQNKGKGGKNRRRGKNENDDDKRELVFREDGQEYAQVTKMLGNGRLEALCFDGEKRLAHIRGKMRKKVRGPKTHRISSIG
jgi:hypothetical protein